jgi:NAD+-dependent farnesol dehydrogenase
VVNGHIAALHKGKLGERYLLTGENASVVQLFDIAAAVTRTAKPYFHIPLWLIEIYGWISVFFSRITGTLPLVSYPVCSNLKPFVFNLQKCPYGMTFHYLHIST